MDAVRVRAGAVAVRFVGGADAVSPPGGAVAARVLAGADACFVWSGAVASSAPTVVGGAAYVTDGDVAVWVWVAEFGAYRCAWVSPADVAVCPCVASAGARV